MDPLVSVIIPTYNRAEYVSQAVQSVLNQTYGQIETIVVDDGSSDSTPEVLSKYQDQIDYMYQERSERSKARNEGFRHSKGDFIAFLDSDDVWLPTKIEKQVRVLNEYPNVGLVYTGVQFIDSRGAPCSQELRWDEPVREALYEDLMTHNVITGSLSSILVLRQCLERVGLFDESMVACEDLDLYRRIAKYYGFHKIDLPLVKIRIHGANTQGGFATMAKGWETTIRKISQDTPREFEYYKYEAIIKILSKLAALSKRDAQLGSFFSFLAGALFHRPNWILAFGLWQALFRLSLKKYFQKPQGYED